MEKIVGRVWKFGDNIYNEQIMHGRWSTRGVTEPEELAEHIFDSIDPTFAKHVKKGDIIVAGKNFGLGALRSHSFVGMRAAGISAIIAESLFYFFYRNAVAHGFLVVECPGISSMVTTGEVIELDIDNNYVKNLTSEAVLSISPIPDSMLRIVEKGGLIPYTVEHLRRRIG